MPVPEEAARPSVSVAMATFNGETYIRAQLDSLARQTLLPVELVVSDDGSTDATIAILQDFTRQAPFPVVLHRNPTRLGYKANFLRATSLCTGDVIAFCDQDDVWFDRKLEIAAAALRDRDTILFHHEARIVRDGSILSDRLGKTLDRTPRVSPLRSRPWVVPPGFTQVFRASLSAHAPLWADSIDFHHPDQRESHDEWHFFLASVLGTIVYDVTPLADYRQHGGNVAGRSTAPLGLPQRLALILEDRSRLHLKLARVAHRRSEILARALASGCSDDSSGKRLRDGARAWEELSEFYRLRADAYTGELLTRVHAFVALVRRGAYGTQAFWSFRPKACVKDLFLGVLCGPLITRYGRSTAEVDWSCVAGEAK